MGRSLTFEVVTWSNVAGSSTLSPVRMASIDLEAVNNMVICIKKGGTCPCKHGGQPGGEGAEGLFSLKESKSRRVSTFGDG